MRWALLTTACLLILDTLLVRTVSHPNLGVYMPALMAIIPLFVGLFYEPCRRFFKKGFGKAVKRLVLAAYAVFFAGFAVICGVLFYTAARQPQPNAQAVIVLGGGLRNDRPSRMLAWRLDKALEYCMDNPQSLLVVSGGLGEGQNVTEAQAMARYLTEKGMDPARILLEDASANTSENLRFSRALLEERIGPLQSAVVVTSDFHLFRALCVAHKLGIPAQGLASRSAWYLLPNSCLREYVALAVYWLRGRI